MKAKVTISRRSSRVGEGTIAIEITDDMSSLLVAAVEMSFEDFAQCITGLGASEAEWTFKPTEFTAKYVGKKRETKLVNLSWSKHGGDSLELKRLIDSHLVDGWMLHNDGMKQQQRQQGEHTITLYRFVEV